MTVPKRLLRFGILSVTLSLLIIITTNYMDFHKVDTHIKGSLEYTKAKIDQIQALNKINNLSSPSETNTSYDPELVNKLSFKLTSDKSRDAIVQSNYKQLQDIINLRIDKPKVDNLVPAPTDPDNYERANATLMVLVRNRELGPVLSTIKQIEDKFNKKFHYPYVFLNDGKFNDRFKEAIKRETSGECYFERIVSDIWDQPSFIDTEKQANEMKQLDKEGVGYANKVSYHNMCRFYSMNFYNHPRMRQFKYYWRFEPNTNYFCDIDYDVFKFMEDNDKTYGFVISLYDAEQSVKTLWPESINFLKQHPNYLHPNAAINWLTENLQNPKKTQGANGYSTCHFWSNFEIADMDFYRAKPYSDWVDYLDQTGGFYYERWGDAPVHSVGVGLFEDKSKIHWFRDIGYKHHPYTLCPNSKKSHGCTVADFTYEHLRDQNCLTNWWNFEMSDQEKKLY